MRNFILCCAFVCVCHLSWGATIYLKTGNSVTGKVVAKTADSVKLDVSGVTVTYYNDEIDRVEGEEAATPPVDVPAVKETAPAAPTVESPVLKDNAVPSAPRVPTLQLPASSAPAAERPSAPTPAVEQLPAPTPVVEASPEPMPVAEPQPTPAPEAKQTSAPVPVAVQPSANDEFAGMTKTDLIMKFIEVFGTKQTMQANFDQMLSSMPSAQGEAFRSAFKVDDIIKELVPLYDKYFLEADLKAFIRFYSSPDGVKLVRTIPFIMKDSIDVSVKYFQAHMPSGIGEAAAPKK